MCILLSLFWGTFRQDIRMKRQIYLLFPIQADSVLLFPLLRLIQIANLQYTIFAYESVSHSCILQSGKTSTFVNGRDERASPSVGRHVCILRRDEPIVYLPFSYSHPAHSSSTVLISKARNPSSTFPSRISSSSCFSSSRLQLQTRFTASGRERAVLPAHPLDS